MCRFRNLAAVLALAAFLFSSSFAQDISNPTCNGPWTSYTATATAQTPGITPPTFTQNSARYKLCGNKTVITQGDFTVTAAGTGAGSVRISLPFTAAAFTYMGISAEIAVTGISGAAFVAASSTFMSSASATNATYIVTGQRVVAEVTYEIP